MHLFNELNIYPFYGAITATILGFITSAIISSIHIKRKFGINYQPTFKALKNIIIGVIIMLIVMYITTYIIPLQVEGRLLSFIIAVVYAIIGGAAYLFYMYKSKTLENVFGKQFLNKIKAKLRKAK